MLEVEDVRHGGTPEQALGGVDERGARRGLGPHAVDVARPGSTRSAGLGPFARGAQERPASTTFLVATGSSGAGWVDVYAHPGGDGVELLAVDRVDVAAEAQRDATGGGRAHLRRQFSQRKSYW